MGKKSKKSKKSKKDEIIVCFKIEGKEKMSELPFKSMIKASKFLRSCLGARRFAYFKRKE